MSPTFWCNRFARRAGIPGRAVNEFNYPRVDAVYTSNLPSGVAANATSIGK